jgi:hypothetical protein
MTTESDNQRPSSLGHASQGQKPVPGSMPQKKDKDQNFTNDRRAEPADSPRNAPLQQQPSPDKKGEDADHEEEPSDSNRANHNRPGHTQSR